MSTLAATGYRMEAISFSVNNSKHAGNVSQREWAWRLMGQTKRSLPPSPHFWPNLLSEQSWVAWPKLSGAHGEVSTTAGVTCRP